MGASAIKNALTAGVDSIVHGFWIDEECAEMMAKKGVYWEPTIRYPSRIAEDGGKSGTPAFYVKNCSMAAEALQQNLLRWVRAGVKITFGSDAGGVPIFFHGERPPAGAEINNVVLIGLVSFFADLSTEMVYPMIPLYLTSVFGATPALVGVIEGIAESLASLLKVFGRAFRSSRR